MNELATLRSPRKSDVKASRTSQNSRIYSHCASSQVLRPKNPTTAHLRTSPVIRPSRHETSPCMLMQEPVTYIQQYAYRL